MHEHMALRCAYRLAQRLHTLQHLAVCELFHRGLHGGRTCNDGDRALVQRHALHALGEQFGICNRQHERASVHVQEIAHVLARRRVQDPVGPIAYFDEQGARLRTVACSAEDS